MSFLLKTESEAISKYEKYSIKSSAMCWTEKPVEMEPSGNPELDYLEARKLFTVPMP
jgi:hypothetical protein